MRDFQFPIMIGRDVAITHKLLDEVSKHYKDQEEYNDYIDIFNKISTRDRANMLRNIYRSWQQKGRN